MVVPVVLLFILLSVIEVLVLKKEKLIRDIFVFLVLMAVALTYSINGLTDWNLPGTSALAEIIFKPLSKLVFPGVGE